jgi:hypothetical protein
MPLAGLMVTACSSVGPVTIKRDRTDYSSAMASSWKEMQLLNIVKFRYFDPPVFLDVPSVVSQQELYGQATFTARLVPNPLVTATRDFYEPAAQSRYTDRHFRGDRGEHDRVAVVRQAYAAAPFIAPFFVSPFDLSQCVISAHGA